MDEDREVVRVGEAHRERGRRILQHGRVSRLLGDTQHAANTGRSCRIACPARGHRCQHRGRIGSQSGRHTNVVAAAAFFVDAFHVITLASHEVERTGTAARQCGAATGFFIDQNRASRARAGGVEEQFGRVIRRHIQVPRAADRRNEQAANTATVIIPEVRTGVEGRQTLHFIGGVRIGRQAGHDNQGRAANVVPESELNAARRTSQPGTEAGLVVRRSAGGGTHHALHVRDRHDILGVFRLCIGGEDDALAVAAELNEADGQRTARSGDGVVERFGGGGCGLVDERAERDIHMDQVAAANSADNTEAFTTEHFEGARSAGPAEAGDRYHAGVGGQVVFHPHRAERVGRAVGTGNVSTVALPLILGATTAQRGDAFRRHREGSRVAFRSAGDRSRIRRDGQAGTRQVRPRRNAIAGDRTGVIVHRRIARALDRSVKVVAAAAFFHCAFDVVLLARDQVDRSGDVLRSRSIAAIEPDEIPATVPFRLAGNLDLVGRIFVRAQEQAGAVIRRNVERVRAGGRRNEITLHREPAVVALITVIRREVRAQAGGVRRVVEILRIGQQGAQGRASDVVITLLRQITTDEAGLRIRALHDLNRADRRTRAVTIRRRHGAGDQVEGRAELAFEDRVVAVVCLADAEIFHVAGRVGRRVEDLRFATDAVGTKAIVAGATEGIHNHVIPAGGELRRNARDRNVDDARSVVAVQIARHQRAIRASRKLVVLFTTARAGPGVRRTPGDANRRRHRRAVIATHQGRSTAVVGIQIVPVRLRNHARHCRIRHSTTLVVVRSEVQTNRQRGDTGSGVELDVVNTHPVAAAVRVVVDAAQAHDVIEARAGLCTHTRQAELSGGVGCIQLRRANQDLALDLYAVEVNFDAVTGIGHVGAFMEVHRVERDRHQVKLVQIAREVEVIAQVVIGGSEGAFSTFFVDCHHTDRGVSTVAGDDRREDAGEVVIVVGIARSLGRVGNWTAGKRIDRSIFLEEGGIGSAAVTGWPTVIVLAYSPEELGIRRNAKAHGRHREDGF